MIIKTNNYLQENTYLKDFIMKKILIWGGTGQIGTHLVRKLTKNNYRVTVITRNIHEKGHKIKIMGNAGYIDLVEASIFEEKKIRNLFENADICINLIGIFCLLYTSDAADE